MFTGWPVRILGTVAGAAVLALTVAVMPMASASAARSPAGPPAPNGAGFRIIQANLDSPNPLPKFRADFATVLAQKPDFMTLNEVGRRSDADLAVPGYAMWRTGGKYPGETPVLWRTDRWTMVDQGTAPILQKHGVPSHKKVELGLRYANWATLVSSDGRTLSLVSVHFTPPIKEWGDLLPRELRHLNDLTSTLATRGPVLIGGDLNVNYAGKFYPRPLMEQYNLTPSYDLLNARVPTGNKYGASIDYVLVNQTNAQLTPIRQFGTALISDHDALTVDWRFNTAPPQPGTLPASSARFEPGRIVNRPHRSKQQRRAVVKLVNRAINKAPTGAAIHLATGNIADRALTRAVLRAHKRGVYVQVLLRDRRINSQEASLRTALGHQMAGRTWFTSCKTAVCKQTATRMAPTTLLVSQSGQTRAVKTTVNRSMGKYAVSKHTRAVLSTDLNSYNRGFHHFFASIG